MTIPSSFKTLSDSYFRPVTFSAESITKSDSDLLTSRCAEKLSESKQTQIKGYLKEKCDWHTIEEQIPQEIFHRFKKECAENFGNF